MGVELRLPEAAPRKKYVIKRIIAPPEAERLIMTHGLVPGNVIIIRNQKASGGAFFVEILYLNRLVTISRTLAEFIILEELKGDGEVEN